MKPASYVMPADLERMAGRSGADHRIVRPHLGGQDPVLSGRFLMVDLRSGLSVHATDAHELHDLTTQITLEPKVSIYVVLDGHLEATLDGAPLEIAGQANAAGAQVWSMTEPTHLVRRSHHGTHVRKVSISMPLSWLDDEDLVGQAGGPVLRRFAREHLSMQAWRPSRRVRHLAEQILGAPEAVPWLRDLHVESRALEIVAEAMAGIAGIEPTHLPAVAPASEAARMRRARHYIEDNLRADLSLDEIARHAGASPTSLQRAFKRTYGTTVIDFVRERRLHQARAALEQDGLTIAQAAYAAGYANASSFSTAFKRLFGAAPRELRP